MKQERYDRIVEYILQDQKKFYRLAFSYVQNQEDALDVVQNSVCRALERWDSLRDIAAVRAWFYRILVNESLLVLKERKRVLVSDEANLELSYEETGFEIQDDLLALIGCLDEETQSVIKLRFFEELSLKEIAQVLDMNLNTVKAKLYRGLKLLKAEIQEVDV